MLNGLHNAPIRCELSLKPIEVSLGSEDNKNHKSEEKYYKHKLCA